MTNIIHINKSFSPRFASWSMDCQSTRGNDCDSFVESGCVRPSYLYSDLILLWLRLSLVLQYHSHSSLPSSLLPHHTQNTINTCSYTTPNQQSGSASTARLYRCIRLDSLSHQCWCSSTGPGTMCKDDSCSCSIPTPYSGHWELCRVMCYVLYTLCEMSSLLLYQSCIVSFYFRF